MIELKSSDWTYTLKESDLVSTVTNDCLISPIDYSVFSIVLGNDEFLRVEKTGEIYSRGRLIETDEQLVKALTDIFQWEQSEIGRLTRENEMLKAQLATHK